MTDRQKDASDFIIAAMICYSNGTDNNGTNKNSLETGKTV